MFELNQRSAEQVTPTALRLSDFTTAQSNITHASFLVWGEHCIECAAPSCYETCTLYDPRPDLRCRRFDSGPIERSDMRYERGTGTEIRFKKWGKVETRGNISLIGVTQLRFIERLILAAAKVLSPLGRMLHKKTKDIRWSFVHQALLERFVRYLQSKTRGAVRPEFFLLEMFNPEEFTQSVQLGFTRSAEERKLINPLVQILPSYKTRLDLPPGYSSHYVPYSDFAAVVDDAHSFDVSITPDGESTPTLVFVTADFVKLKASPAPVAVEGASSKVKAIKCVVWDLDHTMWHGVLAENDNLQLRKGIADLLRHFDERGILLSIASKNDEAPALEALEKFGIKDLFLYPQISWTPKGQSIPAIAKALNIGIDSIAFIDDNPFELEEVQSMNPDVLCINADAIDSLTADPRLQGGTSIEARQRRLMYRKTMERQNAEKSFGGDYFAFLASCRIVLEIAPYDGSDVERVAELVQRTNQLNFSGTKYVRSELDTIIANPELKKFVLRCSDKFGSYGTVGFCIAKVAGQEIFVQDFMLSCRVQSKFIEQAFFHWLRGHFGMPNAPLVINFKPTARNTPAAQVLDSLGFTPSENYGHGGRRLTAQQSLACDFITTVDEQSAVREMANV